MQPKKTIGRIETIDLPELELQQIKAKIDTGAKTSVLHCEDYTLISNNGKEFIKCTFNTKNKTGETISIDRILPVISRKTIKSSFGQSEIRHIFITKICMFDEVYDIELSLRDRKEMTYPMLLGRNFIKGKFLVDVSQTNLARI